MDIWIGVDQAAISRVALGTGHQVDALRTAALGSPSGEVFNSSVVGGCFVHMYMQIQRLFGSWLNPMLSHAASHP
jgi:hypothetical protein